MALDILHSLIVDQPDGMVDRREVMEKVDHQLHKPFGGEHSAAVQQYERDRWGTSSEAIRSAEAWDTMAGDGWVPTFGEPEDDQ